VSAAELHAYSFADGPDLLAEPVWEWLAASRRFRAFAEANASKIRKKLRGARSPASALDLRLELETAYRLTEERSLEIAYEPQSQPRSPDFVVRAGAEAFGLEVTRLQSAAPERLADVVTAKLGQLLPHHPNVLLIGVPPPLPDSETLRAALLAVQQQAERLSPPLHDRSAFFRQHGRLTEVLVREAALGAGGGHPWVNPQAKRPLARKARAALYRAQGIA
jgi:hypothetical protein